VLLSKDFHTPRWSYLVEYALLRQAGFGKDLKHSMVHGVLAKSGESGNREPLLVLRPLVPVAKNQGDSRRANAKVNPEEIGSRCTRVELEPRNSAHQRFDYKLGA